MGEGPKLVFWFMSAHQAEFPPATLVRERLDRRSFRSQAGARMAVFPVFKGF
jgi:hypothetical protein